MDMKTIGDDGYFVEERSAETVIARMRDCDDPRLKEIMSVVTRKLHEAVKEIEPTEEEWMKAIHFLTEVGQICNEWRQEWILFPIFSAFPCWSTRSTTASRAARRNPPFSGLFMWPMRLRCRWAPISASTARARTCW